MKDTRLPHHWRLLLAIVLPIGLMLCVWQAVAVARSQSLERLTHEADNELRLTAASLRGQLSQHAYLPRLVAENDQLRAFLDAPDDPSAEMALNQRLDRMRALAKVSDLYLVNDVGTTIAASNWRCGIHLHRPELSLPPLLEGRHRWRRGTLLRAGDQFRRAWLLLQRQRGESPRAARRGGGQGADRRAGSGMAGSECRHHGHRPHGVIFIASQPDRVLRTLEPLSDETRNRLLDTQRYANQRLRPLRLYHREALSDLSTPEPPLRLDAVTTVELLQLTPGDLWQHAWLSLSRPLPDIGWRLHVLKPLAPLRGSIWQAAGLAAGGYVLLCLLAGLGWQRLRILRERRLFAERERQSLAASQQRVRGIIDRTQAGLCILDERAHLVYLKSYRRSAVRFALERRCLTGRQPPAAQRTRRA